MLEIIYDTLKEMSHLSRFTDQDTVQDKAVNRLLAVLGDEELSAVDIMKRLGLT